MVCFHGCQVSRLQISDLVTIVMDLMHWCHPAAIVEVKRRWNNRKCASWRLKRLSVRVCRDKKREQKPNMRMIGAQRILCKIWVQAALATIMARWFWSNEVHIYKTWHIYMLTTAWLPYWQLDLLFLSVGLFGIPKWLNCGILLRLLLCNAKNTRSVK